LSSGFEFLGKKRDGSGFYAELSVSSFENQGKTYLVLIARDITERKRTQQAIRESEEKYRTLTENIDDFLYTFERGKSLFKPAFYTTSVEKVTGYTQSDFLRDSRLYLKIIHPDDLKFTKNRMKELVRSKTHDSGEFEFRIINKQGNVVWVRNKANLLRDDRKEVQKIFGLVSDITLRKKTEEQLKKTTDNLIKLNETKDQFISIISHDLRTPFSSILGFTELILNDETLNEAEKKQYVRFIRESSGSMISLVNSLIHFLTGQDCRQAG
jgi:PAS domain S-box-containing protein